MFRQLLDRMALPAGRAPLRALLARVPSRCAVCHAWPAQRLCADCLDRFAPAVPRCPTCALRTPQGGPCAACRRAPPPLDACVAAVDYAFPWSGCIAEFKFGGDPGWAAPLAAVMAAAVARTPGASGLLDAADLVLPMPLADARLRERGFNQSLLLARRLAPDRCDARLLLRVRSTAPQHGLDRAARRTNLRGAFALADPARAAGRRVVLVDDVMTSGASVFGVAAVLRAAGAAHVAALVLARTPDD
jgi:ComF family protein